MASPTSVPDDLFRGTAVLVGVLFIAATVLFIIGQTLSAPMLESPDFLTTTTPHASRVTAGVLLETAGILAIPLIALVFYPILRTYHEASALAYVGLRISEAVALLLVGCLKLATVEISRMFVEGGGTDDVVWAMVARVLPVVRDSAFLLSVAVIFPIGALVLNAILWRARLVPRVLAGWGLLGAALLLVGSVPVLIGLLPTVSGALEAFLTLPIALQEMALAVWLITRGVSLPQAVAEVRRGR